jgi:hypothetical protein
MMVAATLAEPLFLRLLPLPVAREDADGSKVEESHAATRAFVGWPPLLEVP